MEACYKQGDKMSGTQKIGLGLLIILITGISAAQATDLVGNWTGSTTGYVGADGAYNLSGKRQH